MSVRNIQVVIDAVRKCAESGMTKKETAASIGLSAPTVQLIAKDNGFRFKNGRYASSGGGFLVARNQEIAARFDAGETLEAIATDHGITRERVRQIVTRMGCKPRREAYGDLRAEIADAARVEWLTTAELVNRFGVSAATVLSAVALAGISLPTRTKQEEDELSALAERVRAGESIRSIAGADHSLEGRLGRYCRSKGIKAAHGRWRDFSDRERIIREGRLAGDSWREIADRLAPVEGYSVKGSALAMWANNNLDDVPSPPPLTRQPRKDRSKPSSRRSGVFAADPDADVIVKDTVRETAIANRGRVTASKIAAAIGVTRNSIIGHWNRAREDGVLA